MLNEQLALERKTVIPFCTSASSGVGSSLMGLQALCGQLSEWKEGKSFFGGVSETEIQEWIQGLEMMENTSK